MRKIVDWPRVQKSKIKHFYARKTPALEPLCGAMGLSEIGRHAFHYCIGRQKCQKTTSGPSPRIPTTKILPRDAPVPAFWRNKATANCRIPQRVPHCCWWSWGLFVFPCLANFRSTDLSTFLSLYSLSLAGFGNRHSRVQGEEGNLFWTVVTGALAREDFYELTGGGIFIGESIIDYDNGNCSPKSSSSTEFGFRLQQ